MSGLELRYFILKPGAEGRHGMASRAALRTYLRVMAPENPELAKDLKEWVDACSLRDRELRNIEDLPK